MRVLNNFIINRGIIVKIMYNKLTNSLIQILMISIICETKKFASVGRYHDTLSGRTGSALVWHSEGRGF